jgi:hypothetical protein
MLRKSLAFLALGILVGCETTGAPQLPAFLQSNNGGSDTVLTASTEHALSKQAALKVALSQSGVTLVGPSGYCVDKTSITRASAALFPCAIFTTSIIEVPDDIGALRLTIEPKTGNNGSIDATALEAFLRSEKGKSMLARSGKADAVQIERTELTKEAFYLRVLDTSPSAYGKTNIGEWRAITQLNGRLSIASAGGYGRIQMEEGASLRLLKSFVATLRSENPITVSKKETNNPLNGIVNKISG